MLCGVPGTEKSLICAWCMGSLPTTIVLGREHIQQIFYYTQVKNQRSYEAFQEDMGQKLSQ